MRSRANLIFLFGKRKKGEFFSPFILLLERITGLGLSARRASVTVGSDSHSGCHSLPPLSNPLSFFLGKEKRENFSLPSSYYWSGLRGSNPPPQPWQGCALPNELNPHFRSAPISLRFPVLTGFPPADLTHVVTISPSDASGRN